MKGCDGQQAVYEPAMHPCDKESHQHPGLHQECGQQVEEEDPFPCHGTTPSGKKASCSHSLATQQDGYKRTGRVKVIQILI